MENKKWLPSDTRNRLIDLCKDRNISQAQLAGVIGIDRSALSRFLSGKTDSMLDALDMFCYEYTPILIQFLKNWGALILAAASFAVSVVSLKRTSKAQDLQDRVNELELQIKQNEVARIEREKAEASLSCIEARVVKIGKGKYRMKVWNSGKATAFNVRAGFDGNPGIFIHDRDMQPFEELESGKGYELVLTVVDGSASKCRIITEWTDADGQKQSKSQMSEISA